MPGMGISFTVRVQRRNERMPTRRRLLHTLPLAAALGTAGCSDVVGTDGPGGDDSESDDDPTSAGDGGTAGTDDADGESDDDTPDPTADGEDATPDSTADEATVRLAVTDGDGERTLVTGAEMGVSDDVRQQRGGGGYVLPVELTDAGRESFLDGLERAGALDAPTEHEIVTYFDGEARYRAALARNLADRMASGEWEGEFVMTFQDRDAARRAGDAIGGG